MDKVTGEWEKIPNMIEYFRQSNLIENVHDEGEIDQSLKAWVFLLEQPELTHQVVREVQRIIVANQTNLRHDQRGVYRDQSRSNVTVGTYLPPSWNEVPALMDDWLEGLDKRTPWVNHVYFEGIHPFYDGNGRTGRMLMWREQTRAGEKPTLFLAAHRHVYFEDLKWGRLVHAADMAEGLR